MAILVVTALLGPAASAAQPRSSPETIQVGPAALPGVGLQLGYVEARDIFTREATLYSAFRPNYRASREALYVTAAVGVAVRIIGGLETMTLIRPRIWDLHLGMRIGPSLFFRRNETPAEKNQRFSLVVDPFLRFTIRPTTRPTYFLEAGVQVPRIRAGVWLHL